MATSGADVLEIDHQVDLAEACRAVPEEIALWGDLDPVGVLDGERLAGPDPALERGREARVGGRRSVDRGSAGRQGGKLG